MALKRTNVEIDEKKLKEAKRIYELETTKELIDFALEEILKAHRKKRILRYKGKVKLDLDFNELRKEK